ncbi:protein associated with UVRAG as autophagy enhancer isoform X2 [Rhinopithecus roxellana]|nr:protein associated with UVRAG as autophagy enhancer isoform X2 [Rhinopithecus roxellana]XP_030777782.1 protein associated with UVRAG as autophagy enhancer isoform X2 [Rhinopithecus roxellana]XP_030777783.1 protein associated with UVRAG as autophagy enhancer isoform X2 [Rhinopithecus roxellana]
MHTSHKPGKMVSQSTVKQDSPEDPWEGITHYSGIIDGSPGLLNTDHPPCQLDIRLMRHKAAWINPQDVQQQLQDLQPQVPAAGNSGTHFVTDAASPSGPSPSCLRDSLAETTLSEATTDSTGSASPHGSREKSSRFSLSSTEVHMARPGYSHQVSLPTSPRILVTSPYPETDSAFFEPSHLTSAAAEGAVQVSRRTISLNSFSPEVFVLPVDVEKENAHFHVADMIISAMEKMKCNILSQQQTENWSKEEASGLLGSDQPDSDVTFDTNIKQESGSSTSSYSGYEGCAVLQVSPVTETRTYHDVKEICQCDIDEFVILELGDFNDITETCSCSCSSSKSVTYEPEFNSAELLAKELYRVFRKCWILSLVNSQLAGSLSAAGSIVVNEERVRKNFESSMNVVQEIKFKSRIRGTEDWAPPRFQIIFNIHPPLKRDLVVAAQNFFCAGCGTPIEPKFVKRLRYCEYLGKYFCDCCHSYAESCIPARILMMWDFKKYYVSNFSKRLLDSIWHQPIFNLLSIGRSLYAKAKELGRVKEIQEQLFHIKKLLKTCRFADSALKEFEQVPGHLTDELHLFSLEDLARIKKGLLAPLLKVILKASLAHVAGCELCQGKGFICEFCQNTTVIFPFQTATCRRCSVCRACFHKQCFQSSECPRCARITARRKLLESMASTAT